jgi:hypothetical protein
MQLKLLTGGNAMPISIRLDENQKTVTITMPIEEELRPSASGKTLIVATTRGLKTASSTYYGRPVFAAANVFIYRQDKAGAATKVRSRVNPNKRNAASGK